MIRRPSTSDFSSKHRRRGRSASGARLKRTIRTLLSPEQLNQAMSRESARVDRKRGGSVTLVLFRIPDPSAKGRKSLSAVRLAKTILQRIRITDDLGWFDENHLGLLLPDTPAAGAWRLAQAVCDIVGKRAERPLVTMYTYPASGAGTAQAQGVFRTEVPAPTAAAAVKVAS
ncbi:MAG TPA: hypothetical protein VH518_11150 [Tepidisphaeraceae bacterium]|jgi:hypothetical protein